MSDRGPSGQDPDPTEFFPPLPPEAPTGPVDLPPIGSDRDPEPTRVMPAPPPPPVTQYPPTTAVPPTGGGPYDPGPPYGGGGGGAGGPGGPGGPYGDPELNPEPDPWYRQPGPLAALIAGVAAVIVAVIALLVWTSGGDENSDETLPSVSSTTVAPTTVATTVPATTTTSTVPATTSSTTSTTTSTTSTTTSTTTTTTLPPTTTTLAPTTPPPTTTTTPPPPTTVPPPVTVPLDPDATMWDLIQADPSLSRFRDAVIGSNTEDLFDGDDNYTVLAPVNGAFDGQTGQFDVNDYLIAGNLSISELFNLREVEVVGGATLAVDPADWSVGGARVTMSSEADNGQVNVISSFVTPNG